MSHICSDWPVKGPENPFKKVDEAAKAFFQSETVPFCLNAPAGQARGRTGGRPRTDPEKLEQARMLYLHSKKTAAEVCQMVGIGRRTLFSHLARTRPREEAATAL